MPVFLLVGAALLLSAKRLIKPLLTIYFVTR